MESEDIITIIMAGGLGKRMNTNIPKVLNLLNEKPLIYYVIKQALQINSKHILIVVGKYREQIKTEIELLFTEEECSRITYINQQEINIDNVLKVQGTGDAIRSCLYFFINNNISFNTKTLILSGDVPLIQMRTIRQLLEKENTLLITKLEKPTGCGRIILSDDDKIKQIIEEKDCSEEEKLINLVNCGIYNLSVKLLLDCIPKITNNNKNQEYYLTDVVEIANNKGFSLNYYQLPKKNNYEIININTQEDLFIANTVVIN
jgi:bifunctional N-acetylglucosamine-1-phosphate-uridyltransferase/glucosamine-1-phosphate-acetyltransferase GlmU-like protein